jgi:methionyl-tRNA formyltransferase
LKVLLLGKRARPIQRCIEASGCRSFLLQDPIDMEFLKKNPVDFMVSYGYRHIIRQSIIESIKGRIVNLHISLLPWNRGADPNLWSFLEDTPKGVTIHYIDRGIDTGDIIAQKEVFFDVEIESLSTTYDQLSRCVEALFCEHWPAIMQGKANRTRQTASGTFHRMADKEPYLPLLSAEGWNTPVRVLIGRALMDRKE